MFETIRWDGDAVVLIDQRILPTKEEYLACRDAEAVAAAIKDMVVRGAPAIGVTAAFGIVLGLRQARAKSPDGLREALASVSELMAGTRPTAVNLFWAIERMKKRFGELLPSGVEATLSGLEKEALSIQAEDIDMNRRMGRHGAALVPDGARILTHCNAGALATAGYGTALGVMRACVEAGKRIEVLADETRPFLQGARLTAWELNKDQIPVTLITDNMAGHFMARGAIDLVIVGSDRIVANGDVANKIGTYSVAVLAKEHGIPFYVAAPTSTFDLSISSGKDIPIEERSPDEVTHVQGVRIAPEGVGVRNPAFDVTPNRLVTAIVCENGVARAPYGESLRQLASARAA
ncbi:MAG TPA: S-methyl-5-thioribose-1-phosphate isomerase [Vicinamibacteria bacterium]|nr:S-methyl-5-thioribose-1-phosphate isomerase [Vicinamibacteria bacterium]